MTNSRTSFFYYSAIFLLIAMAACSGLWELWEQDIFWQIRAGTEFLNTFQFSTRDLWSYTAYGDPWSNYQWLSTLIIAKIFNMTDVVGLICCRAILLFLLLSIFLKNIRTVLFDKNIFLTATLLLPMAYAALVPRVQIRPEFFVIVLCSVLVTFWVSLKSYRLKILASLFLILLATNLHPGVAPFLMLFAGAFAWRGKEHLVEWSIFCVAVIACFFCHPYAKELPYFLFRHFFYQSHTLLANDEYLPLSLSDFNILNSALFAWSWLIILVMGGVVLFRKKFALILPICYRNKFIILPLYFLLVGLCFNRPRAIPFLVIFLLPALAVLIERELVKFSSQSLRAVLVCLSLSWGGLQIFLDRKPLGLKVNAPLYPVETVSFIQVHHPQSNILHMPKWGDYLLGAIPEYKIFFDAREIQYDKIQFLAQNMYNSPTLMNEIIEHYRIQTVLLASDFFQMPFKKGDPTWSRREAFFPTSKWAVVSYDSISFLLLARTPEHEALIKQFEYQYLIPDIPVSFYRRSNETDLRYGEEIKRCRSEHPRLRYCMEAEQAWPKRL